MTRKIMKLIRITLNTENMEGGGDLGAGKGGGDTADKSHNKVFLVLAQYN